jgi:hypothetical protein
MFDKLCLKKGGGQKVYITGTFSGWKTIPMVKRFNSIVKISLHS